MDKKPKKPSNGLLWIVGGIFLLIALYVMGGLVIEARQEARDEAKLALPTSGRLA